MIIVGIIIGIVVGGGLAVWLTTTVLRNKLLAKSQQVLKDAEEKGLQDLATKTQYDPSRLEQEIFFYIEKLDITEEKVRLRKHCNYFLETMEEPQANGKKLAFIVQECGREINTMGSKSNDFNIQQIVVRMKDELEKLKEQLANIL